MARFLSVPYLNRGKKSLDADEIWIMIAEENGNPARFVKRQGDREERLDFRMTSEPGQRAMKRIRPIVTGPGDVERIAEFFGLDWDIETEAPRAILVLPGRLEFIDDGELILGLAI